jgi:D-alanine-D-alanine ligase
VIEVPSLYEERLNILIAYNEPTLSRDSPDWASEAGVLESVTSVEDSLSRQGHRVQRLGIRSLEGLLHDLPQVKQADVVFNLFEGLGGVSRGEAEVAGLFELAGYPLTGSPSACLSLVRDKPRTKWLLAGASVPTANFEFVPAVGEIDCPRLEALVNEGPTIVKPAHEDGSLGIGPESIVDELDALVRQVERVRGRYGAVLVERFIVGREFNVAIIDFGEPRALPLAEIEFRGSERDGWQIVTYDAKWSVGSEADRATPSRCPAHVDDATSRRIADVALDAYRLCGCRGYARVDLRLGRDGAVYVLEMNANPDIGPSAGFEKSLVTSGIAYDEFLDRLVRSTFERGAR